MGSSTFDAYPFQQFAQFSKDAATTIGSPQVVGNPVPSSLSPQTQTGLTALHVAVIKGDRHKVRALLASREHAVNERTSTGTTPLMLASLYGRFDIFLYLLHKSASISKQDHEGFNCSDYVKHLDFTGPLLKRFEVVADGKPRRSGRKSIYELLRPFSSILKQGGLRSSVPPAEAPRSEPSERRIVSLRKNGIFEIGEFKSLALAEWPFKLGRKTCAAVRVASETYYKAIAISGWRGDEALQVVNVATCLNNAEVFKITRNLAKVVGYQLKSNYLDHKYEGSPVEKAGAFHTCHAEKQLAVFILVESMGRVLGTQDISLENLAKLRLAVGQEAEGIQKEFIIELEHKPCPCCIAFIKMIYEKSGLQFRWIQREWFSEGKRPQLRPLKGDKASSKDLITTQDVIDAADDDWQLVPEPIRGVAAPASPGDDTDNSWVIVRHPRTPKPRRNREHRIPKKAGSEVGEKDFPFPARRNISRRMLLKEKRKQKQKTADSRQFPLSPDRLSLESSNPNTPSGMSSSSQASEGRIRRLNFEIPIRTVGASPAREPFPKMSEFMSLWGASSS